MITNTTNDILVGLPTLNLFRMQQNGMTINDVPVGKNYYAIQEVNDVYKVIPSTGLIIEVQYTLTLLNV